MANWKPTITVKIPNDIDAGQHADIRKAIDALNAKLQTESFGRKSDAVERSAWALFRSGVGACGVAGATRR